MTRRGFLGTLAASAAIGGDRPAPSTMGLSPDCFRHNKVPRTPYEYLEFAHSIGAGGVQAIFGQQFDAEYLKKTRRRAEDLGMYLEITTSLPKQDTEEFERVVKAAKEAGARCIRSVCLSGRRYENFSSLAEWRDFVAGSHARLGRALPIIERNRIPLGLENHKDWTIEEMVPLLRQYGGEYMGVCFDWGNNISLLDDPMETVEALAPYVVNSHIKDMAVQEYGDGFLLAEVPLGEGFFDLKRMLDIVVKHRPSTRFSLDMLTRNPLKIPCIRDKYWATFPQRNGRFLARMLAMVRAHPPARPLMDADDMEPGVRASIETQNVRKCLDYARDSLGLKPA